MSLYLGENLISGNKPINLGVRNIGEVFPALLPVTDAGAHLLDGSLILGGGIYQGFVDYIATLYGDGTNIPSYFCTEAEWQTAVTTYGVCGKFVYDSTLNTVRLPKVTGIIEGTTDINALGDLVEAGLPNITGVVGATKSDAQVSGAFYHTSGLLGGNALQQANQFYGTAIDASRSSSIYGNSLTVQPQTIKAFVYIVIANSTKTETQVDIDEVATDLNGKADTDLTNITDTGKILMSEMAMPSDTYIALTLGASGSLYTAPANGWVYASGHVGTTNQWGKLRIYAVETVGGTNYSISSLSNGSSSNSYVDLILPVKKGYTFSLQYIGSMSADSLKFWYAQGSESEA